MMNIIESQITNSNFIFIVPTSEPTTDDQILGNLDMTTMIGIFGGVFIALVVGFICVCIFVRKMQKGEKEDTAPPQQSFASFAPSTTVCSMI